MASTLNEKRFALNKTTYEPFHMQMCCRMPPRAQTMILRC